MAAGRKTGGRKAGTPNRPKIGHRPPYAPTDQDRRIVSVMAAAGGIDHDRISDAVGVSGKTLRKHFRRELDTANTNAPSDPPEDLATTLRNLVAVLELLAPLLAKMITMRWPGDPPPISWNFESHAKNGRSPARDLEQEDG